MSTKIDMPAKLKKKSPPDWQCNAYSCEAKKDLCRKFLTAKQ